MYWITRKKHLFIIVKCDIIFSGYFQLQVKNNTTISYRHFSIIILYTDPKITFFSSFCWSKRIAFVCFVSNLLFVYYVFFFFYNWQFLKINVPRLKCYVVCLWGITTRNIKGISNFDILIKSVGASIKETSARFCVMLRALNGCVLGKIWKKPFPSTTTLLASLLLQ